MLLALKMLNDSKECLLHKPQIASNGTKDKDPGIDDKTLKPDKQNGKPIGKKDDLTDDPAQKLPKPKDTKPNAIKWRELGDKLRMEKKYDGALNAYKNAVDIDQNDDHSHYWRGRIYDHGEIYDEAKKSYQGAIIANPKRADSFYRLGLIYYMESKYDAAVKAFDRAIKEQPMFPKAYYSRGLSYIKLNDTRQAIKDLNTSIQQDPKLDRAHFNLGDIYLKSKNYNEALSPILQRTLN